MNQYLFAIYDGKAFAFIPPFTMPTPEMAIRSFQECANEKTHMFCKHPLDFCLFQFGHFDDNLGEFEIYENKINLGFAATYQSEGT